MADPIAIPIPIGLIIGLIVYLATRTRRPPNPPRRPLFEGKQIVGVRCIVCDTAIATVFVGRWCKHCDKAVHHDCLARHMAPTDGVYR
jgi:hypothetical protein